MSRTHSKRLLMTSILASALVLAACAASDTRDNRERELAADRERCPVGEILSCHSSAAGRISDGRFGRRSGRSEFCSCQPESDIDGMAGRPLPSEPR